MWRFSYRRGKVLINQPSLVGPATKIGSFLPAKENTNDASFVNTRIAPYQRSAWGTFAPISFRNIFHNRSPRNQHCIFICVPVLRVETGDLHSRWIKNQTDFGILSKNIGSLSPRCSAIPINQSLGHICTKSLLRSNEIHATTLSPFTIRIANKLSYFSQFFSHIDDHKFINFDFK